VRVATKYNKRQPLPGRQPNEAGGGGQAPSPVTNEVTNEPITPADKNAIPSEARRGEYELNALNSKPQSQTSTINEPVPLEASPNPHDLSLSGGPRALTFRMRNLNGTTDQPHAYCGFGTSSRQDPAFQQYPSWSVILADADIWKRIIVAAGFGLAVQWGTTIPAVLSRI
jgi:hypothetical protein